MTKSMPVYVSPFFQELNQYLNLAVDIMAHLPFTLEDFGWGEPFESSIEILKYKRTIKYDACAPPFRTWLKRHRHGFTLDLIQDLMRWNLSKQCALAKHQIFDEIETVTPAIENFILKHVTNLSGMSYTEHDFSDSMTTVGACSFKLKMPKMDDTDDMCQNKVIFCLFKSLNERESMEIVIADASDAQLIIDVSLAQRPQSCQTLYQSYTDEDDITSLYATQPALQDLADAFGIESRAFEQVLIHLCTTPLPQYVFVNGKAMPKLARIGEFRPAQDLGHSIFMPAWERSYLYIDAGCDSDRSEDAEVKELYEMEEVLEEDLQLEDELDSSDSSDESSDEDDVI
eukprot:TRINITY_DN6766_c0_g1_i1.p1 TRINITY_DN6766_c0_g1~~TRINITY_DN6766_c0_g1_i1.p1  ORF type:complete len:343 (-),score=73.77 TRINITY_DN6766_c0_g1_i1:35-1063(-)